MRILVTGASGFIGRALCSALLAEGHAVRAGVCRAWPWASSPFRDHPQLEPVHACLETPASLAKACEGVQALVHCAGHAHAFPASRADAQKDAKAHALINAQGSAHLVEAATHAKVKRLVFLSSVRAVAAQGPWPMDETHTHAPTDPYGHAKRAAENALWASPTLEGVVLRPVLVYGPGGRGNLERLIRAQRHGWFPGLPETGHTRSFVHLDDLIRAIVLALFHPHAPGHTYIVAHPKAVSGAQLQALILTALGRPSPRWRWPLRVFQTAAALGEALERVLGQGLPLNRTVLERLLGPGAYCSARLSAELGWQARIGLEEGLAALCAPWREASHG